MSPNIIEGVIRIKMKTANAQNRRLCAAITAALHHLAKTHGQTSHSQQSQYETILIQRAAAHISPQDLPSALSPNPKPRVERRRGMFQQPEPPLPSPGENAFIAVVRSRHEGLVQKMLPKTRFLNRGTPFFGSALTAAVQSGSAPILLTLLSICYNRAHYAQYNQPDIAIYHLYDLFEEAAMLGHISILTAMISCPSYTLRRPDKNYDRAIFASVRHGHQATTVYLLDHRIPQPNSLDEASFWMSLVQQGLQTASEVVLQRVLELQSPFSLTNDAVSATQLGTMFGQCKKRSVIRALVVKCPPDEHNWCLYADILFWAAHTGDEETVLLLLDRVCLGRSKSRKVAVHVMALGLAISGAEKGEQWGIVQAIVDRTIVLEDASTWSADERADARREAMAEIERLLGRDETRQLRMPRNGSDGRSHDLSFLPSR